MHLGAFTSQAWFHITADAAGGCMPNIVTEPAQDAQGWLRLNM